jgi:hypothetical protein
VIRRQSALGKAFVDNSCQRRGQVSGIPEKQAELVGQAHMEFLSVAAA